MGYLQKVLDLPLKVIDCDGDIGGGVLNGEIVPIIGVADALLQAHLLILLEKFAS